jgi:anion-transporting  ArsA/GET3 family ATPase
MDLLDRALLFVSGKGGVGKTTVAAGLALAAARRGQRVLLCEVDARGDVGAAFETGPVGFVPRAVADGPSLMALDTEASLREYLRIYLKLPFVTRLGPLARAFDFVATAAPGVREILIVGKLCYEVRERHYDLVVADAAASGHITSQLAAPESIARLVRVGMVRGQTGWMSEMLGDPTQTGLVLVATPEEMPVNETLELAGRVRAETRVDLAAVVANRVLPELFGYREEETFEALARPEHRAVLEEIAGPAVDRVLDGTRLAVSLRRRGAGHLARLRQGLPSEVPMLYVPYLFARSTGLRATRQVADALAAELG